MLYPLSYEGGLAAGSQATAGGPAPAEARACRDLHSWVPCASYVG